jgi:heme-degrading monooxygenase HmoA
MIARWWTGRTAPEQADAYERLLLTEVLPGIRRHQGHRGAWLLRRASGGQVEFATLTLWESMDAVHAFAGDPPDTAVVPPAAWRLLADYDRTAVHYAVVLAPNEG